MVLYVDIETYSSVDLTTCGVYAYAESPDFEILMIQWAYDNDPVQVAATPEEIDRALRNLGFMDVTTLKIAHNAQFERVCFSAVLLEGAEPFTYLPPDEWDDTAALAASHGYPRSLDKLAKALGVEEKDSAGTSLINWFCKPDRNGKRRMPQDHPEKWEQFKDYGRQDVVTLRQIHQALPDWASGEREIFLADQEINDRGIAVDLDMCHAAAAIDGANKVRASAELEALLGVKNTVPQVTKALGLPNLQAATVTRILADPNTDERTRRALELRQATALVSADKYRAAIRQASGDGRVRGQYRYFGAHTGRWSSRGIQVHNFARESVITKAEEESLTAAQIERLADQRIATKILDLILGFDPGPEEIKVLVRSMLVGPFTVVDYSAIEARVLAWVAGESWVLDAFRAKRDIYVETAKRMGGLTRQQGKVAVLALGYQGGVNSLRGMGAQGTDEELQELRDLYREANPRIQRLWRSMERAFIDGGQAGRLQVTGRKRDRYLVLPSGRALTYHNVRVSQGDWGPDITFDDPKGFRAHTYGGRLVENAIQAISRDLLADSILRLEDAGFRVVGHVHDEVVIEGTREVEEIAKVMRDAPSWADGLPVDVEGFRCARYRK